MLAESLEEDQYSLDQESELNLGDKVFKRGTIINEPEFPTVWSLKPKVMNSRPADVRKVRSPKV